MPPTTMSRHEALAKMNQQSTATGCATPNPVRVNKFNAVRTVTENASYDSRKEARDGESLFQMQDAGLIRDLEIHPRYRIEVNGLKICDYEADARFVTCCEIELNTLDGMRTFPAGVQITTDSKGFKNRVYLMKRKLMWAVLGIEVIEV
jgi:hypothetical protein